MGRDLVWVEPNLVPTARESVRAYYLACQPIEQFFAAQFFDGHDTHAVARAKYQRQLRFGSGVVYRKVT